MGSCLRETQHTDLWSSFSRGPNRGLDLALEACHLAWQTFCWLGEEQSEAANARDRQMT